MPTLRQLRDRVKSLKNTQQITRAMKMVAGARIRRAELAMRAARPYAQAIRDTLAQLSASGIPGGDPLMEQRDVRAAGVLLMTADKGLCGAFNSNLVRAGLQTAAQSKGQAKLYLVGAKGRTQLRKTGYEILEYRPLQSEPFVQMARGLAMRLMDDFKSGAIDALTLVSSRFVSTIVQRPTAAVLLPVRPPESDAPKPAPGTKNAFEFEPDTASVLKTLLPKYFEFTIFQALLETQASEFAARLLAMTNATDNAGKLIDELTLVMNKTRQAAITKEILEIVGGAEALKG
jgi:F-type H+-transporting ATPase subunit gamma